MEVVLSHRAIDGSHEITAMLGELIEKGTLKPVMDRTYDLNHAPEALRYLDVRRKIVVRIDSSDTHPKTNKQELD